MKLRKVKNFVTRQGNPPVGSSIIGSKDGWDLYLLSTGANEKTKHVWANLKLVSNVPRARKANYWLAYNTTALDFSRARRDNVSLEGEFPELLRWIETQVLAHYGNGGMKVLHENSVEDFL